MTCLNPQEGLLGGRELKNLCLITTSQGLLCPFELAQVGKVRIGTSVVPGVRRSLMDIRGWEGVSLGLEDSILLS